MLNQQSKTNDDSPAAGIFKITGSTTEQFRKLWETQGIDPNIFEFLKQKNLRSPEEIGDVVILDQLFRQKTKTLLNVEEYLAHLPALQKAPLVIFEILANELKLREPTSVQEMQLRINALSTFFGAGVTIEIDKESGVEVGVTDDFLNCATKLSSSEHLLESSEITPPLFAFEDYEFLEEIGSGGMGVVYKARQLTLNRVVAVKSIKSGQFAETEQIRRFYSEVRALAKLDHPGIVPVYDVGEYKGQHFFTMALVTGESLDKRVKNFGPNSPREAALTMKAVAESMEYAHRKGVIHRDIKPHNILIDSVNGKPYVTDFGLAKQIENEGDITTTGQVMGTPSYMPPEQAIGKHGEAEAAADIYSMGATLYYLLVARPPFQAASPTETINQVLNATPVSPCSLNPNVPKDLATICLKCLNKNVDARYASSQHLADDLERWLSGEAILARPVTVLEKAWRWSRQRPALLATVCSAVTLLLIVILVLRNDRNEAEAARIVNGLLKADISEVEEIIRAELVELRDYATDDLQSAIHISKPESNARLHAELAMLPSNPSLLPHLRNRLLRVSSRQFQYVRNLLAGHHDRLNDYYWGIAKENGDPELRFRAACALATFDSENQYWEEPSFQAFIADKLVTERISDMPLWLNALRPVKRHLIDGLVSVYRNSKVGEKSHLLVTDALADYLNDHADGLFDLLADASEKQFLPIYEKLANHSDRAIMLGNLEVKKELVGKFKEKEKESLAIRKANAAILLMKLNAPEQVWPLLKHTSDPRLRSYIIHWFPRREGDFRILVDRFKIETDLSVKRALVLCIGEFELPESHRKPLIDVFIEMFRNESDAGLHGAVEWTLRRWGCAEMVNSIQKEWQQLANQSEPFSVDESQWFVNGQGQTFVKLDPGEFFMGTPDHQHPRSPEEHYQAKKISRRFAIGTKEVSRAQWRAFSASYDFWNADQKSLEHIGSDDGPMVGMNWFEAIRYCNWLSKVEGIPEDQWCFEIGGDRPLDVSIKDNFWELTGYRLPTEAEWEYACRSGATTRRYFGETETLLGYYAIHQNNSDDRLHPAATLKPNEFGMFDTLGNAGEFCFDLFSSGKSNALADFPSTEIGRLAATRLVRGGDFFDRSREVRAARRHKMVQHFRDFTVGFRVARTLKSDP